MNDNQNIKLENIKMSLLNKTDFNFLVQALSDQITKTISNEGVVLKVLELKGIDGPRGPKGDSIIGPQGKQGIQGEKPIKGKDYFTTEEIDEFLKKITPIKGKDYFTDDDIAIIVKRATPVKGRDYFDGKDGFGLNGVDGKDAPPIDEEKLKTKILAELNFTEKEKKLLKTLEEKLIAMVQRLQIQGGGGGLSRQEVLDLITGSQLGLVRDDLSAQCNGVNKIFTTTQSYKTATILLQSTQFPIIYRPITDFTESADKEITLTAAVSAPQTGQTLVIVYEQA